MLFIETDTPPPFYREELTAARRKQLDQWFISHRSQDYYLKRFEQFDKQGYLSPKWHWAAFFMTFFWLLYRKRYIDAIVYTIHDCLCAYQKQKKMKKVKENLQYIIKMFCKDIKDYNILISILRAILEIYEFEAEEEAHEESDEFLV